MIWGRLEYRARAMAPYYQLAKGPSSASKSVLLDYVSALMPVAMFRSLRNQHFFVSLAILGTILLKILIILSTGLLSLSQVAMIEPSTKLRLSTELQEKLGPVGNIAAEVLLGDVLYDLPYPWGTTEKYAFQKFDSSDDSDSPVLSADVETFHGWLDCEDANFTVHEWYFSAFYGNNNVQGILPTVWQNATIVSPSCEIRSITRDTNLINAPTSFDEQIWANGSFEFGRFVQPTQTKQAFANFYHIQCEGQSGPDSRRLYWQVTQVIGDPPKYPNNASLEQGFNATSNVTVLRSSQKICKPRYAVEKTNVKLNISSKIDPVISKLPMSQPRVLSGLHPFDIPDTMFSIAYGTILPQGVSAAIYPGNALPAIMLDWQSALAIPPEYTRNLDKLFQPGVIEDLFQKYYARFAAQVAAQGLFLPAASGVSGTVEVFRDRLFVRIAAVRAMEALLAILILLTLLMIVFLPRKGVVPFDPCSIVGVAGVVLNSPTFKALLLGMGHCRLSVLKKRLRLATYESAFSESEGRRHFTIRQSAIRTESEPMYHAEPAGSAQSITWWRPVTARVEIRVLLALIILCFMGVLEATVQISRHYHGLVDLPSETYIHYAWTIIPAFLMVSIGIACRSMDQSTKIFAPFASLRSGCSYDKALKSNFLSQSSAWALWTAAWKRHWAVCATTTTVILASFLTILVSGVYSITIVPLTIPVHVRPLTWFNGTYDTTLNQALQGEGVTRSALILLANMSYPSSTFETLAFPTVELLDTEHKNLVTSTKIYIQVPAVRAVLTCDSCHNASILKATVQRVFTNIPNIIDIEASLPLPEVCAESLLAHRLAINVPVSPQTAFGHADADSSFEYLDIDPRLCPLFDFYWGSYKKPHIEHMAALGCHEHLETVDVNVTFDYPSFTINTDTGPPKILEETARYFSNTTLATPYTESMRFFPSIRPQPINEDPEPIDGFFASLVDSRYGIPQEFLTDPNHDQDVIDAIKFQHGVIRAQQFATWIRIPADSASAHGFDDRVFTATLINPNRRRLTADPVSTRVLEAILGIMAVFLLLSCWFGDTKWVLPHNPCSIAGTASLLVDSRHLGQIAELAERADGQIRKEGGPGLTSLREQRWRMGWFEGEKESRDSISTRPAFTIDLEELYDDSKTEMPRIAIEEDDDAPTKWKFRDDGEEKDDPPQEDVLRLPSQTRPSQATTPTKGFLDPDETGIEQGGSDRAAIDLASPD